MRADRHRDLGACAASPYAGRLHATLCALNPGGIGRRLSAVRAADLLRTIRPVSQVQTERNALAKELLGDVHRLDGQLVASKRGSRRPAASESATGSTRAVTQLNHALHMAAVIPGG